MINLSDQTHPAADLDSLLKQCGSPYDRAALLSLLAGVLAAPEARDRDNWVHLVAAEPSVELSQALIALKAEAMAAQADRPTPSAAERLAALRQACRAQGCDGFVVPHADEFQNEYLPAKAERLAWLTGFTGSAGTAVILEEKAAIFVDGRYTLQVRDEVEDTLYEPRHMTEEPADQWIEDNLPAGATLGYDPWLHSEDQVGRLAKAVAKAGGTLKACDDNPLDQVWQAQPAPPISPVSLHGLEFAGEDSASKRQVLAEALRKDKVDAVVLTATDSIAWLLNVRGGDVAHTPLALSYALLFADGTLRWFIDRRKLTPAVERELGNGVLIAEIGDLGPALDQLGADGKQVMADPAKAAAWIFSRLRDAGCQVVKGDDPCQRPKACKNAVEIEGTRCAHRRDGAALVRFLAWFAQEAPRRTDGLGEIEAAERLLAFRQENAEFLDLSFETISGAGANGAIVHYRVQSQTERRLQPGDLYLVDSGAQYRDGTTDVTRTLAVGTPSDEMRERFTRVLKGHITLATARFPKGTSGSQLDILARVSLWQIGLDFDHGTGHGVGSYLGVHEGPQRISKVPNRVALEPGMIVSNEPGYYKTGAYGIRIENLVTVIENPTEGGEERPMLGFETLTLAPIDKALIDKELLTKAEVAWLDGYHATVRDRLLPLLDGDTQAWLKTATKPL